MNEAYKRSGYNWMALVAILAISIGSPLLLHYLLKPKETPQPVALQQVQRPNSPIPLVVTQQVFSGIQVVPQIITQQVVQVVTQHEVRVEIQQFKEVDEVKPTPKLDVTWLGSPVTRAWQKSGDSSWETIGGQLNSLHSPPTYKIGLRSDGTVIWKKEE